MNSDSQLIWEAYTTTNEGILKTAGHIALDVGGLVAGPVGGAVGSLVPGAGTVAGAAVGETIGAGFDLTNAIWYATEGEYLNAALSIISLIPIVGDVVGKGGRLAIYLAKGAKVLKSTGTAGRVGAKGIIRGRKAIVAAGPKINMIKTTIKASRALIDGAFDKASKNEKLKPHVEKMKSALHAFTGEFVPPIQPPPQSPIQSPAQAQTATKMPAPSTA